LNGSLDDLALQDVLQVLSICRKTGCLFLETPVGGGAIVFREGRVVASIDEISPLLPGGVESPTGPEGDESIRERTVAFVHRLVRSGQGEFSFEATTHSPRVVRDRGAATGAGMDVIELLIAVASRPLVHDEELVRRS
jgi:hypothetical protein